MISPLKGISYQWETMMCFLLEDSTFDVRKFRSFNVETSPQAVQRFKKIYYMNKMQKK